MTFEDKSTFGTMDYCFFGAMLLISTLIGIFAAFRGNKSPEEFLMGNRAFGPLPIAMSLVTSFISAISLLGFSGETYAYGMQIIGFIPGAVLGIGTAAFTTAPVIHPLKLTSVNEYIELRFKSPYLRRVITTLTTAKGLLYMGTCLYAPSLALSAVTPLSSFTYIFILGAVVTLYSSIGGIKAVVWTDVFQLTVMFFGLLIINGIGLYVTGSPTTVWNTAMAGHRLDIFNLDLSIYTRHTMWNTIAGGYVFCSAFFGVSQVNVQRLCAVRSMRDVYIVLILTMIGMTVVYFLIFMSGTLAYVAYAGCDPVARGVIEKKDEIMPYMVVDKFAFVTGLPGIFVATIIGGALSSLSSVINALVAMIWKDYCSQIKYFANCKPAMAGIINKVISFSIGGVALGMAVVASNAKSLIQFTVTLTSVTFGPIYGVFLLALLFPRTNVKGVWAGIVVSLVLVGWICGGAFFYAPSAKALPVSTDQCFSLGLNVTESDDLSKAIYSTDPKPSNVTDEPPLDDPFENFPLMYLYGISYILYGTVGVIVCVVVGIVVSCLTGNEKLSEVSPEYIAPWVRVLYWSREELKEAMKKDDVEDELYLQTINHETNNITYNHVNGKH